MPAAIAPAASAPVPSRVLAPLANGTVKRELSDDNQDDIEVIKRVKKEKTGLGSEIKPIVVSEVSILLIIAEELSADDRRLTPQNEVSERERESSISRWNDDER